MATQATQPKTVTIYALASSNDMRERYIGQSVQALQDRLRDHFLQAKKHQHRHLSHWIARVLTDGHEVIILPLQFDAIWSDDERWWIAQYRAAGYRLVNGTDGGEGCLGLKRGPMPLAQRAILSAKLKERRVTPIEKLRLSIKKALAARGPNSPETRAKISAALTGTTRELSPEQKAAYAARASAIMSDPATRAKVSKALTGRTLSPETIAKRTASRRANGGYVVSETTRQKQSTSATSGWDKRRRKD